MLKIGLTGGIGSGKSTVTELFYQLGVPIIDMDIIAREVVMPGQPALEEIKSEFGTDICTINGELDRRKLRDIIFSDEKKRNKLELIIHPRIRQVVAEKLSILSEPYCIIVIPLLFETGRQGDVDRILVIDSTVEQQIQRTGLRDKIEPGYVERIIASQTDRETRLANADDIIENTGDIAELSSKVKQFHQKYLELAQEY